MAQATAIKWERVVCPWCERSLSISPKEHRFGLHRAAVPHDPTEYWCYGSNCTPEEARIGTLNVAALESVVRSALDSGTATTAAEGIAALEDLRAKYEQEYREKPDYY